MTDLTPRAKAIKDYTEQQILNLIANDPEMSETIRQALKGIKSTCTTDEKVNYVAKRLEADLSSELYRARKAATTSSAQAYSAMMETCIDMALAFVDMRSIAAKAIANLAGVTVVKARGRACEARSA